MNEPTVAMVREDLFIRPSACVVIAARAVAAIGLEKLPGWLVELAAGSLEHWSRECSEARLRILEDEHRLDQAKVGR